MNLIKYRLRYHEETWCSECGMPLDAGDVAVIDEETELAYCSTHCAEADTRRQSARIPKEAQP